MWLYGSGFPKSLDIGKALDKRARADREVTGSRDKRGAFGGVAYAQDKWTLAQANQPLKLPITAPSTPAAKLWNGFGTALKPAWEPIILAMKPCEGTFAENALKHGVAGLAIDAGRIGTERTATRVSFNRKGHDGWQRPWNQTGDAPQSREHESLGRWPANVILDEEAAAILDQQSGVTSQGHWTNRREIGGNGIYGGGGFRDVDEGRKLRDSGGASRFFYCAKASRSERGEGNTHPTVKPLKLCEYLARLILPPNPGARLLVPFAGSGSEMIGARRAGWKHITGIEREKPYVKIAERRLQKTA